MYLQENVAFAAYVDAAEAADLVVAIRTAPAGPDDQRWTITFTGRRSFTGEDRRFEFVMSSAATPDQYRPEVARLVRIGLAEYAASTPLGADLNVTVRSRAGPTEPTGTQAEHDPWNYWVFRVSVFGDRNGEKSTASRYYDLGLSANRTTDHWKLRVSGYRDVSSSRFDVDDELTITSRQVDWSYSGLAVKSLGEHWSAGVTASMAGSTYSNQKSVATVQPGVEFDLFPYSESTRRSLTVQYTVGGSRYRYLAETIFEKLEESIPRQDLYVSLGLRQPWGSAGGSARFFQQLNEPARNRLTLSGNLSVRLTRGLSVNGSLSFSRIRDQFYLEKGDASEEEVLLRQRQLATGHRVSTSFGLTYSFGSLSNATVNPRFGG